MTGVIVARFQVPVLTSGHKALIKAAATNCDTLIFLLGVPANALPTKRNPLPFNSRAHMVRAHMDLLPTKAVILPLYDMQVHKEWANQIDLLIDATVGQTPCALFGGRDSAIWTYAANSGRRSVVEIDSADISAGTDIRAEQDLIDSHDFRAGAIWATNAQMKFPRINSCVDIAIFTGDEVLLARKGDDPIGEWRLVGGHVDKNDLSHELAATREAREETGLEIGHLRYVGSCHIDDWRYRSDVECIKSSVFACDYIFGRAEPKDDIAEVRWFHIAEASAVIMAAHRVPLWMALTDRTKQDVKVAA